MGLSVTITDIGVWYEPLTRKFRRIPKREEVLQPTGILCRTSRLNGSNINGIVWARMGAAFHKKGSSFGTVSVA
jgi:hypothetical protein